MEVRGLHLDQRAEQLLHRRRRAVQRRRAAPGRRRRGRGGAARRPARGGLPHAKPAWVPPCFARPARGRRRCPRAGSATPPGPRPGPGGPRASGAGPGAGRSWPTSAPAPCTSRSPAGVTITMRRPGMRRSSCPPAFTVACSSLSMDTRPPGARSTRVMRCLRTRCSPVPVAHDQERLGPVQVVQHALVVLRHVDDEEAGRRRRSRHSTWPRADPGSRLPSVFEGALHDRRSAPPSRALFRMTGADAFAGRKGKNGVASFIHSSGRIGPRVVRRGRGQEDRAPRTRSPSAHTISASRATVGTRSSLMPSSLAGSAGLSRPRPRPRNLPAPPTAPAAPARAGA